MLNRLQDNNWQDDSTCDQIVISPIGNVNSRLCDSIAYHVQLFFGFRTQVNSLIDDIEFAFDADRKQYHSTPILRKLTDNAPHRTLKILAVTHVDLFIPILTFVYGEAQLGGTSCIISTNRLYPYPGYDREESDRNRIIKESIHELGHTFNLRHCKEKTCAMHYCRTLEDVDLKLHQYCRYCLVFLSDEIKTLSLKNTVPDISN